MAAAVSVMKLLLLSLGLALVVGDDARHGGSRDESRHAQNYPDYQPDYYPGIHPYPGPGNPYVPPSRCK